MFLSTPQQLPHQASINSFLAVFSPASRAPASSVSLPSAALHQAAQFALQALPRLLDAVFPFAAMTACVASVDAASTTLPAFSPLDVNRVKARIAQQQSNFSSSSSSSSAVFSTTDSFDAQVNTLISLLVFVAECRRQQQTLAKELAVAFKLVVDAIDHDDSRARRARHKHLVSKRSLVDATIAAIESVGAAVSNEHAAQLAAFLENVEFFPSHTASASAISSSERLQLIVAHFPFKRGFEPEASRVTSGNGRLVFLSPPLRALAPSGGVYSRHCILRRIDEEYKEAAMPHSPPLSDSDRQWLESCRVLMTVATHATSTLDGNAMPTTEMQVLPAAASPTSDLPASSSDIQEISASATVDATDDADDDNNGDSDSGFDDSMLLEAQYAMSADEPDAAAAISASETGSVDISATDSHTANVTETDSWDAFQQRCEASDTRSIGQMFTLSTPSLIRTSLPPPPTNARLIALVSDAMATAGCHRALADVWRLVVGADVVAASNSAAAIAAARVKVQWRDAMSVDAARIDSMWMPTAVSLLQTQISASASALALRSSPLSVSPSNVTAALAAAVRQNVTVCAHMVELFGPFACRSRRRDAVVSSTNIAYSDVHLLPLLVSMWLSARALLFHRIHHDIDCRGSPDAGNNTAVHGADEFGFDFKSDKLLSSLLIRIRKLLQHYLEIKMISAALPAPSSFSAAIIANARESGNEEPAEIELGGYAGRYVSIGLPSPSSSTTSSTPGDILLLLSDILSPYRLPDTGNGRRRTETIPDETSLSSDQLGYVDIRFNNSNKVANFYLNSYSILIHINRKISKQNILSNISVNLPCMFSKV